MTIGVEVSFERLSKMREIFRVYNLTGGSLFVEGVGMVLGSSLVDVTGVVSKERLVQSEGNRLLLSGGSIKIERYLDSSLVRVLTSGGSDFVVARHYEAGGGGGGVVPGGGGYQFQYNGSGSFAGSSGLVYDSGNNRVGVGQVTPLTLMDIGGVLGIRGSGGLPAAPGLYLQYASSVGTISAVNAGVGGIELRLSGYPITFYNASSGVSMGSFDVNGLTCVKLTALSGGVFAYSGVDYTSVMDIGIQRGGSSVNLGLLLAPRGSGAITARVGGNARGLNAIEFNTYGSSSVAQVASGVNSIAIGSATTASSVSGIAVGFGSLCTGAEGIAIGVSASATNVESVAIGSVATVSGSYGVAIGFLSSCVGAYSIALGFSSSVSGSSSLAGPSGVVSSNYSTSLNGGSSTYDHGLVIGSGSASLGVNLGVARFAPNVSNRSGWSIKVIRISTAGGDYSPDASLSMVASRMYVIRATILESLRHIGTHYRNWYSRVYYVSIADGIMRTVIEGTDTSNSGGVLSTVSAVVSTNDFVITLSSNVAGYGNPSSGDVGDVTVILEYMDHLYT